MLVRKRVLMMASMTCHSIYRRFIPQISMFPLGINARMVHPNSHGIYPVLHIYWTMSMICIHLPSLGGEGGGHSLSWIGLADPHLGVLRAEVSVAVCIVGAEASDHCPQLCL